MRAIKYIWLRANGIPKDLAHHEAYCKKEDEEWTLESFGILDNLHFGSEHQVECKCCGHKRTASRGWLRGDAWPGDLGSTYSEAYKKAEVCGHVS